MDDVKFGEILGPEKERETKVRAGFWRTLRKAAKVVPFSEELVAGYYCALDPTTPGRVRAILIAALAYFVVPIDIVPDFLAGIGFGDDLRQRLITQARDQPAEFEWRKIAKCLG